MLESFSSNLLHANLVMLIFILNSDFEKDLYAKNLIYIKSKI